MSFTTRFHEVAAEVRNWGRWGEDDRLGTLNLLTDEVGCRGGDDPFGRRVSLALPLSRDGVQLGQVRPSPTLRSMHCINNPDLGDADGLAMVPASMTTMSLGLEPRPLRRPLSA